MQWQVTVPPAAQLLTTAQLAYRLRIDSTLMADGNQPADLASMLAAAVEFAEDSMQASLITRTIQATYWLTDSESGYDSYSFDQNNAGLVLPRGPVQSLASVINGDTTDITSKCTLQRVGNTDWLKIPLGWIEPLTVTYTAGWGATAANVPADIIQAIFLHVGSMYENRTPINDVPDSLRAFYHRKSRQGVIG